VRVCSEKFRHSTIESYPQDSIEEEVFKAGERKRSLATEKGKKIADNGF